ncbi:MAG: rRNA pseudouridine synthase [Fibrobacterales bacterium]
MRINKYIAQSSSASRRGADILITEGRVTLNGEVVTEPGVQIKADDIVTVDGKQLTPTEITGTILFNKPENYVCSKKDTHGRPTIFDLLPLEYKDFNYIGRLDLNSRGLMLLSSDGELIHRLTHPSYDIPRTYEVRLDKIFDERSAHKLQNGVLIDENEKTRPAEVKFQGKNVEMILREGKKREIRRMMSAVGYEVIDLKRVSYGNIELRDLEERKCRPLTDSEVKVLYEMVQLR